MSATRNATDSERPPEMWKAKQVCEALNLSHATVYRLMDSGKLPYARFGRARRVKLSDVMRLLEECTVARA